MVRSSIQYVTALICGSLVHRSQSQGFCGDYNITLSCPSPTDNDDEIFCCGAICCDRHDYDEFRSDVTTMGTDSVSGDGGTPYGTGTIVFSAFTVGMIVCVFFAFHRFARHRRDGGRCSSACECLGACLQTVVNFFSNCFRAIGSGIQSCCRKIKKACTCGCCRRHTTSARDAEFDSRTENINSTPTSSSTDPDLYLETTDSTASGISGINNLTYASAASSNEDRLAPPPYPGPPVPGANAPPTYEPPDSPSSNSSSESHPPRTSNSPPPDYPSSDHTLPPPYPVTSFTPEEDAGNNAPPPPYPGAFS